MTKTLNSFIFAVEHMLGIISDIDFSCSPSQCVRKYILKSHGFLLLENCILSQGHICYIRGGKQAGDSSDDDYSVWFSLPLIVTSNIATVLWNLPELLIISFSFGLTSRYRRLNHCVVDVLAKSENDGKFCKNVEAVKVYTWRKIREAYVKQSMLVRKVDGCLGGLVLTSNLFNLYFVCLKLFLLITQGLVDALLTEICYIVTLVWVLIKATFCVLAAADVNRCSKMALPCLYRCDSRYYNVEIERLQVQLDKEHVALSGMGFFYLSRNMILQMGATVITYVLVLIQYDGSGKDVAVGPATINSTLVY